MLKAGQVGIRRARKIGAQGSLRWRALREAWLGIVHDAVKKNQFDTSSGVIPGLFLVDAMSFGQHALMKYARYQDAPCFEAIKHHMPGMFHAALVLSPNGAIYLSPSLG